MNCPLFPPLLTPLSFIVNIFWVFHRKVKRHTYFSKQVSDCLFTTLHTRALFYTKNQRLLPTGIYHTTNGLILKMGKTKVLPTLGAVSTKMHTTVSCATRQILDKQKMSCATRQVSWHFFSKWKKCRVPHDNFHDIFFQNKNSVVCHMTRHILLLLWKIKYLCRVHFSILNCTRQLFLGRFQTFPIFYNVTQCGMVNWAYVSNFSFLTSLEGGNICVVCILVY